MYVVIDVDILTSLPRQADVDGTAKTAHVSKVRPHVASCFVLHQQSGPLSALHNAYVDQVAGIGSPKMLLIGSR